MRSGSLRHPFPEEINRRVAGRLVHIHFPPTDRDAGNLRRHRGLKVTTGANTIIDAVRYALDHPRPTSLTLPDRYGLATLHRFELVSREDLYRTALETLREYSVKLPIIYFAGASERERMVQYGLLDLFDRENFRLEEKMSYVAFLPVLARATFVVTDSGGLQEECGHLGIPCAVHRTKTERHDRRGPAGRARPASMTRKLRAFLDDYDRTGSNGPRRFHPSKTVADAVDALAWKMPRRLHRRGIGRQPSTRPSAAPA